MNGFIRATDDVEEGELRRCGPAADLHELAVTRRASARKPAAPEDDPARELVDGAEVDEHASPRGLAEDLDTERGLVEHGLQRRAREPVELREGEVRLRRDAAPHRLDRAV